MATIDWSANTTQNRASNGMDSLSLPALLGFAGQALVKFAADPVQVITTLLYKKVVGRIDVFFDFHFYFEEHPCQYPRVGMIDSEDHSSRPSSVIIALESLLVLRHSFLKGWQA